MVSGLEHLPEAELEAGGVFTVEMAEADEALGFVERDPVADAVGKPVNHDGRIVGEPVGTVGIEPAAPHEQVVGKVPVEQRNPWLDTGGEELIDQAVVETEAGFVHLAAAGGHHPGPRHRKTIGLELDIRHQRHVGGESVVVVARDVAIVAFPHATFLVGVHIPDGWPFAVGLPGSLDLIGRRSGAPSEVGRKRRCHRKVWMGTG